MKKKKTVVTPEVLQNRRKLLDLIIYFSIKFSPKKSNHPFGIKIDFFFFEKTKTKTEIIIKKKIFLITILENEYLLIHALFFEEPIQFSCLHPHLHELLPVTLLFIFISVLTSEKPFEKIFSKILLHESSFLGRLSRILAFQI
jgi:hypothetical protein